MKNKLSDEEIASRIISIYFENVARQGFKKQLNLDAVINAYLYTLSRLKNKEKELKSIEELVTKEESTIAQETKEEILPQPKEE